ncbi:hypothetical protein F5J12DRAFT_853051 [Pisolithus orientalis]|uniref:uncharacterized protein n=1 Tax=Pisolithus orientalis TaxID=936130 RepID=UPI00222535FF|nr:uncharacterized protein F5J12DRAFT_853051 [Pisolithus orientalis]KAI5996567.1 hypothetical protein F5J12DRAFT_853051 [Pisolithus orientalis]
MMTAAGGYVRSAYALFMISSGASSSSPRNQQYVNSLRPGQNIRHSMSEWRRSYPHAGAPWRQGTSSGRRTVLVVGPIQYTFGDVGKPYATGQRLASSRNDTLHGTLMSKNISSTADS